MNESPVTIALTPRQVPIVKRAIQKVVARSAKVGTKSLEISRADALELVGFLADDWDSEGDSKRIAKKLHRSLDDWDKVNNVNP